MQGKKALITGGATGIGRAIALTLARAGADVSIVYSRSEQEAQETVQEISALGVKGMACQADVADDGQVRNAVKETLAAFGGLDILVNGAGTTFFVNNADLDGVRSEHWDRIMDVNVKGCFQCSRAAAASLKERRGCIVNITSVAGISGMGSSIAYAASKAAMICLTKSLARVLAPHIRVNSVAPGVVETRWVAGHEDYVTSQGEKTPLGKLATSEDVAQMVYALIEHAGAVTGQTVVVDGGALL
ncbi:MAG: 3-oxoacyl-[acyl-carrier protein] reductase [Desulfovibrionales bacterium]|nr:3-oxoacyl-[acyl-carrier protein] reductase [Desulfovibrionales bacterium]